MTGKRSYIEVDASPNLLAGSHCKYFELGRRHPVASFQKLLVWQVIDRINGSVGSESEQVFPNRQSSEEGLSVEVTIDVHVSKIIEMFPDPHLGFWALVTLGAGVIVVDHAALEPVLIVKFIGSVFGVGGIANVEIRGRNNFLIGVYHSDVDYFSCQTRSRIEGLNFEAERIVALVDLEEGL